MNSQPLLIYLHGLNSAPQSAKAQQVKDYIQNHALDIECWIPQLSHWPEEIKTLLKDRVQPDANHRPIYIIGSSLGGFLGTWLQQHIYQLTDQRYCPKLVLLNPAAQPFSLIEKYLGMQQNTYTGEIWELTWTHVEQLRTMTISRLADPNAIFLLLQKGDQTLDYRHALKKYRGCRHLIEDGGSHAFENFPRVLPAIFSFFAE